MKNPSFGALHSPLSSQSKMQGRKPEEEIQQPAFSHGYAKFRTPCETIEKFHMALPFLPILFSLFFLAKQPLRMICQGMSG